MNDVNKNVNEIRKKLSCLAESDEDCDKALALSASCAQSPHRWLRINAYHCFGYIARVYRRLDLNVALPLIRTGQDDADPEIVAAARDALKDLEVYLPGFKAWRRY